jgi:hypothetical protein
MALSVQRATLNNDTPISGYVTAPEREGKRHTPERSNNHGR